MRKTLLSAFLFVLLMLSSGATICSATVGSPKAEHWEALYEGGINALDRHNYNEAKGLLFRSLDLVGNDVWKSLMSLRALEQVFEETENHAAKEQVLLTHLTLVKGNNALRLPCM